MQDKIKKILNGLIAGIDVESQKLVTDGYINSITMAQLIWELDAAFDIKITFAAISKDNFNSVEAIEKMVKDFQKQA